MTYFKALLFLSYSSNLNLIRLVDNCFLFFSFQSVSRQHAVINVLNSREYMLMDLDSANKTKLLNKILQPYIPHPLRDGDTVQFGDIFGVFRLLEEDNELPMTQAIDIPETPVVIKHVSKLNKVPTTLIPESPDVSDRDDSFATPQNRSAKSKLSNSSFIHLNNKSISTKPETSPKTYGNRKTSKPANSLSFISNPNTSLNESLISLKADKNVVDDIHDMDTQAPNPNANESTDSIYTANTQVPPRLSSPSIHSLDTQVPSTEHLPQVRKIDGQHEMQLDIYAANKENNRDIFNAETQPFLCDESLEAANKNNLINKKISDTSTKSESKDKVNTSEEELLFDDVDGEIFDEDFNSQNILQDELPFKEELVKTKPEESSPVAFKRDKRIASDASTDCEDMDMQPTQKIPELPIEKNKQQNDTNCLKRTTRIKSDSSTDCEDIDIASTQIIPELPIKKNTTKGEGKIDKNSNVNPSKRVNRIKSDSSTDCEDIDLIPTQKIPEKKDAVCDDDVIEINDAPSDKLDEDNIATQIIDLDNYVKEKVPFEDMPTQIIDIDEVASKSKDVSFEDQPTQIIDEVEVIPDNTVRVKNSVAETVSPFKVPSSIKLKSKDTPKVTPKDANKSKQMNDDNYYNATQDIYEDLCSQKDLEVVDDKTKEAGKHDNVAHLKRIPSDSSDETSTPKKTKPFVFTDSDLPDSQEIKKNVLSHTRANVTDSSSESEVENCSEDQFTPVVHRKKKKSIPKLDLTKMLEFNKLPERVLTRQRKPTYKIKGCDEVSKKLSESILKPAYLTEQEDQIDGDIIKENIERLKTYEKAKTNKDSKVEEIVKEEKKPSTSRKKTDSKSSEPKEKIKVKIEKPKKKETKTKSESRKDKKSNEAGKDTSKEETTRTLRTRTKKVDIIDKSEQKPVTESNKKEPVNKRNSSTKKQEKERSKSPEIEVRRSKRQRKTKENFEDSQKGLKSILKKSVHEQSTVYNISSSSSESPKSLKRSLVDSDAPSPKRTRGGNTSSMNKNDNTSISNISNASLRATPARVMKTHHVLFTAFPSAEVKQKLEKLGAVIVTDVMQCSVVLTMSIKRTFKLLCAVGLGRPIVGPGWVQACVDTHIVVDPWLYLMKDESAEKRFQFNLQKTLSSKRNFLKGYNVSSTPSVQPNATEMKLIVECSGGTWKEGGANWVCVSCPKDNAMWPALRKRGATVVSTEFILGGVLRQKIDIENNTFK
uniref:Mediator of DNA damage checkpoint protein 1 n=1 Tax=Heliothis virescens TaxID=7102 RepID=A0A2A4JIH5_HELVI